MPQNKKLLAAMTLTDFDHGYWYATEIKAFAKSIGISGVATLRKDELEDLIRHFLRTGKVAQSKRERRTRGGIRDSERGLKLGLRVINYINDKATKVFLEVEVQRLTPRLRMKPGARYRLNRWREKQLKDGGKLTYGDLVTRYQELNLTRGSFPQARSGRYINFLSDYMVKEGDPSREEALQAWRKLKELDIPKDYRSWKAHQRAKEQDLDR